jgi:hypothetical protein
MKRPLRTVSGPILGLLVIAVTVPSMAGCDPFEPRMLPLGDTVSLYSLARPEYIGRPSAFDFYSPVSVVLESLRARGPDDFDVAFTEADGQFLFLPAGLFETFSIRPGVVRITSGESFEALEVAPSEGYVTEESVPLEAGGLYAVRSRDVGACSRYAKFEVLDLDPDGVVEFRFLRNNLCNDRTLTLPDEE